MRGPRRDRDRVVRFARRRRVLRGAAAAANVLLGDGAVEPLRGSLAAGRAEAFPFKAAASSAAGAVHVYIDARSKARRVVVGLYADAGGRPGALLAAGSLSRPKAGAWDTATIAPVQLVPGAGYWLVVLGGGGTPRIREGAGGSCEAETSVQRRLAALTAVWRAGGLRSTCPISAYATRGR